MKGKFDAFKHLKVLRLLANCSRLATYLPTLIERLCDILFLVPTAYLSAARLTVKPFLEFKIKKNKEKGKKEEDIFFRNHVMYHTSRSTK